MINTQNLNNSDYENLRFELINQLETSNNLDPLLNPIIDIEGLPTIGVGLNLSDASSRNIAFLSFGIEQDANIDPVDAGYATELINIINQTWTPSQVSQLRDDLNEVMMRRANDTNVLASNRRSTFAFLDRMESIDAFDDRIITDENVVSSRISGVNDSLERAVLVSLAFNSPTLIGPGLRTAFNNNDRPEAWFEIRHNSNLGLDLGIARRRYIESKVFGLYDISNPGPNFQPPEMDALKVFRTFNKHEARISLYEASLNGAISIANADIAAINSRLTGISIASILPVRMEFEPARTVLINNFATLQTDIQQALSTIAPGSPLLAPSSLDGVYVSAPIQSSQAGEITAFTVDRNGRESQANRIYSGTNDLIFGGIDEAGVSGGNDTLRGASGDDLFIGGLGADLHDGGAGEDTVSYLRSASGVTVDLQGTGLGGQAAGDTYISIENILGSPNADTITGNGANNTIIGFEGNDVLDGGGGDDILFGYVGNDELDGGEGTDTAVFSDIFDNYEFQLSADGQTITAIHSGGSGIDGTDTLTNIEFGQFQDRNVSLSGIDLTFVIDATGSMFDDIAAVQSQVTQIIQQTAENVPFTRFSLVTYRDPGQTQTDSPFTADTSQIISAINNISVGGGGDFPEGVNSGLLHALRNEQGLGPWRPSPTPRSIILIGDAPARDTELRSEVIALANSETISIDETILLSSTSTLALASSFATATATSEPTLLPVQPVTIFPIAIGGNSQTLADFQEIATATGGTLLTAVNASDIVSVLLDAIEQATQFPIALPDFATTTSTDITLLDLLANDSDPNGDSLSLVEIEGIAIVPGAEILISSGALLSVNSDGTVTYNPNNQFNELAEGEIFSDTFTYTITDGNGTDSALATIEIAGTLPLILGTEELETLAGTSEGERLDGLGGDDTLKGFGGNDLILGGDGDDSLKGGSGTDKLMGASGADSLDGGDGDDLLQGGSENDFLRGGQGNDTLEGGEGNDELMDTQGDDVLDGGNGLDTLKGGLDNDSLLGGNDDDILLGNSGNDTLVGGAGNDQLTGGQDADLFVLAAGEGKDTVVDFRIAQNDRFGLSGDLAFEQLIFTASTASSGTDILFADEILATVENITISALNNAELFVTL